MSTLAMSGARAYDFNFSPETKGVSNPAEAISAAAHNALDHFTKTFVNRTPLNRLEQELVSIFFKCNQQGWDGYDAIPLSDVAVKRAMEYVSNLPKEILFPEITPEPDGEVALEWYGKNGSVFSISFSKSDTDTISYAGLFSDNTQTHGVERLDSSDKKILEKFITRALSN
ncbi:MAG: hypothetical protein Q8M57_07795 [Nitrosomonas sp.]|uniref:hypothetical protein n=1 Tax=Nitrosomonas sp. TaxID=42353 RepID=UPI0027352AED|nr:hypothetical protein [Nitrosomonas sp.]MDP3280933.1 hypothetical protein [Nitrosomonas sp.]